MRRYIKSLLIVCLVMLSACSVIQLSKDSTSDTAPSPKTPNVELNASGVSYQGQITSDGSVEYFLGVPFAKAPVGELRWESPQPLEQTTTASKVLANKFSAACMQGPHLSNWYKDVISSFGGDPDGFVTPEISEDCLHLNIWKNRETNHLGSSSASEKQPVFVFIHGGSNKGGWSYEPNYIGEQLAKQGVIVVTIAYRVGAFGFFAHPELAHANFGLLDQIAALKWIKNNIGQLGGDPENITLAGESAGANNIDYLMASPLAQGLFQKVVHQSGGSVLHDRTSKQSYQSLGEQLAAQVLQRKDGSIADLRRVSAEAVLSGASEVYADHYFDPVVDGHSVIEPLSSSIAAGHLAKVDLLIGANADEWTVYVQPEQTIESWMAENIPEQSVTDVKRLLDNGESKVKQLDRLITAYHFVCPSLSMAKAVSEIGGRAWFYYFSRVRPGELAATMGAYHGAELPYVFGTHDDWLPTDEEDLVVGDSVMNYWVNFMHSGNPNIGKDAGLLNWPPYKAEGDYVQNINTVISSEVHSSQALCRFVLSN